MRQGDPLGGPLFVLAHYWALLKTIAWALSYVFPSLIDDTHIVGPMSELSCAFDHRLTQLAWVGLRVKVSKCKFWSLLRIFPNRKNSSWLHFGHRWPFDFLGASGFSWLCHAFFGWNFILGCGAYWWSSSLSGCPNYFGFFVFMCNSSTFLFHTDNTSFFFLISLSRFWLKSYASMWGHYGSKIVGIFLRPFNEAWDSTTNIFWWYRPFFMEDCAPSIFIRSWVLVASYLCSRFHVFDRLVLEVYVSQVEGGPYLL